MGYVFEKVKVNAYKLRAYDRVELDSPAFRGKRIATVQKIEYRNGDGNGPWITFATRDGGALPPNQYCSSDYFRRVKRNY